MRDDSFAITWQDRRQRITSYQGSLLESDFFCNGRMAPPQPGGIAAVSKGPKTFESKDERTRDRLEAKTFDDRRKYTSKATKTALRRLRYLRNV